MICDTCTRLGHACRHRITALHEVIEGHTFTECPYYEPEPTPWLGGCLMAIALWAVAVGAVIALVVLA
jgi:hypothetical protein